MNLKWMNLFFFTVLAVWLGVALYGAGRCEFVGSNDGADAAIVARRLAGGKGYTVNALWQYFLPTAVVHPEDAWPLAFPTLIAASMRLFGDNPVSWRIPGLLCVVLTALSLKRFAASLFGSAGAGIAASLLWLALGCYNAMQLWNNSLLVLLTTALLIAVLRCREASGSYRPFVFLGLIIGAGYLSKPDFIVAALIGCLWLFFAQRGRGAVYGASRGLCLALVLASVVASPYWVRNYGLFGNPVHSMVRFQRLGVHYLGFWPIYEVRYGKPFTYEEVVRQIGVAGIIRTDVDALMSLRFLFQGMSGWLLILLVFCVIWKARWSGEERDALVLWAAAFAGHGIFIVLYSRYEERYFWPYYPFACAFVAGISREFYRSTPRVRRMVYSSVLLCFLWGVGRAAVTDACVFFKNPWRVVEPLKWIAGNTAPGDVITGAMAMETAFHTGRDTLAIPTGDIDVIAGTMDRFGSRYIFIERGDEREAVQRLLDSGDRTGKFRTVRSGSFVVPYEPLGGGIDYRIMVRR